MPKVESGPIPPDPKEHIRSLLKAAQTHDPDHVAKYQEQVLERAQSLMRPR